MSGYVRIHRALLGHSAFRNDAEAMAFAWLVCRAQWKPARVRYKDRAIVLGRGQLAISVRDFATAMDRDKAWVERLLKRLRAETMIETRNETGVNVVTILNYDVYQVCEKDGETPVETAAETEARQGRDTEQVREEGKKEEEGSVANATDADGVDPLKLLFQMGRQILMDAGKTKEQAGSLIGMYRKDNTDAEVMAALIECRTKAISAPVEWLAKRLAGAKYVSASGFKYRGDAEAVMREAEKRADWNTYWKAKADLERAPDQAPQRKPAAARAPPNPQIVSIVKGVTNQLRATG